MASGTISLNAASDQLGGQQSAVDNWVRKYETEGAAAFFPRAGNRGYNRKTAGQTVLTFSEVLTARSAVHSKKTTSGNQTGCRKCRKFPFYFTVIPTGNSSFRCGAFPCFFRLFSQFFLLRFSKAPDALQCMNFRAFRDF